MRFTIQKINFANSVLAAGAAVCLAASSYAPNAYSQQKFNTEKEAKSTAATEPSTRAILFQDQNEDVDFCADLNQKEEAEGHDLAYNRTTGKRVDHSQFGYFDVTSTSSQPTAIRPAALEKLRQLLETGWFQLSLCRMASARPSVLQATPGLRDGGRVQIADVRPTTITIGETVYFGKEREKVGAPDWESYTQYNRDGAPVTSSYSVQHYRYVPGERSVRGTVNIPGVETWYANLNPSTEPIEDMRESCATWVGDQPTMAFFAKQHAASRAKAEADAEAKAKQEAEKREKAGADALAKAKQEAEQKFATAEQDALSAGGWKSLEEYLSHATEFANYRTKLIQFKQEHQRNFAHRFPAFWRANGTTVISSGGQTQLKASIALDQVLEFAPGNRSDSRFLRLKKIVEAGPEEWDVNYDATFAAMKRGFVLEEARNSVPHADLAAQTSTDLPVDRDRLLADGNFQWERCSHYYPSLWPKIQEAIINRVKTQ